jgi:hypothetical protein
MGRHPRSINPRPQAVCHPLLPRIYKLEKIAGKSEGFREQGVQSDALAKHRPSAVFHASKLFLNEFHMIEIRLAKKYSEHS